MLPASSPKDRVLGRIDSRRIALPERPVCPMKTADPEEPWVPLSVVVESKLSFFWWGRVTIWRSPWRSGALRGGAWIPGVFSGTREMAFEGLLVWCTGIRRAEASVFVGRGKRRVVTLTGCMGYVCCDNLVVQCGSPESWGGGGLEIPRKPTGTDAERWQRHFPWAAVWGKMVTLFPRHPRRSHPPPPQNTRLWPIKSPSGTNKIEHMQEIRHLYPKTATRVCFHFWSSYRSLSGANARVKHDLPCISHCGWMFWLQGEMNMN